MNVPAAVMALESRVAFAVEMPLRRSRVRSNPLLALSYQLTELPTRDAYLQAASACLSELLPGDDTFWLEADFGRQRASTRHGASATPDPALGRLLIEAHDHPAIRSYLAYPDDLSPRRLSDVAGDRRWRGTYAHELLGGAMGRHQLSLIVRLAAPSRGSGWTIGRSRKDFTDTELDLAGALLPLLTTLDRLYERQPVTPVQGLLQAREWVALTSREAEMLTLLGEGLTAVAIGHLLRISSGTVRKHLQHLYAKLGCHDRLMAVQEARRLGVLPPLTNY